MRITELEKSELLERARKLERDRKWQEAAYFWGMLAAIEHETGHQNGKALFYEENASACMQLHQAIKRGNKLRDLCNRSMEDIESLPEEEKKDIAWQIKGYAAGILNRDSRLEVEVFFNTYPAAPKQTIINWAHEFYEQWKD